MKFRWKLLILLLMISIIPVVSLRTFGIQNVRSMAEALISQVKEKQTDAARHRLQLVIDDYSKVIRTGREQAEMALFYQTFEMRRVLQTETLPSGPSNPCPGADAHDTVSNETIRCQQIRIVSSLGARFQDGASYDGDVAGHNYHYQSRRAVY